MQDPDPQTHDTALDGMFWSEGEWRAYLPESVGTFLGQPLVVAVTTASDDTAAPSPPTKSELQLCLRILSHLRDILRSAETSLLSYRPEFSTESVSEAVEIWLHREVRADRGEGHWSLLVPIESAVGYGIYIDFDDLTPVEVWGG
jgi:hypothetical protein